MVCRDCAPGTFSVAPAAECSACAKGTYSSRAARTVCDLCDASRFGNQTGLTSPNCTGPAEAGYYTPAGSQSARQFRCGSQALYCPPASGSPRPVPDGYYGAATADGTLNMQKVVAPCPVGFSCIGGIKSACAAGRLQPSEGSTSCQACPPGRFSSAVQASVCAGLCPAGYFCAGGNTGFDGSNPPEPCGDQSKYCPAGSSFAAVVPAGFVQISDTHNVSLGTDIGACALGTQAAYCDSSREWGRGHRNSSHVGLHRCTVQPRRGDPRQCPTAATHCRPARRPRNEARLRSVPPAAPVRLASERSVPQGATRMHKAALPVACVRAARRRAPAMRLAAILAARAPMRAARAMWNAVNASPAPHRRAR